jgi:hypothetical protein
MKLQSYNLLLTIKDTVYYIANRKPKIYEVGNNFVALFWIVKSDQDSIYEMFDTKDDMEFYTTQVKNNFEGLYPDLHLDVKYTYGPVEIDNTMYSRILYYYYDKSYQNTNISFIC